MKITFEAQHLCVPDLRGIPQYSINLINALCRRQRNEYALIFFDKNKERNNGHKYIFPLFNKTNIQKIECNHESYIDMIKYRDIAEGINYNNRVGVESDLFHFMFPDCMPRLINGKLVVTVHDLIPIMYPALLNPKLKPLFEQGIKRLENNDATIIADSYNTKNDLIKLTSINENRIHVIHISYNEDIMYPDEDINKIKAFNINQPYILYLAAIVPQKGIESILEMFKQIAKMQPDIKLVIAGFLTYVHPAILTKIIKHPYRSRIVLTDYVTEDQKRGLISNAMLFLFPSKYEGFGIPVLEAMACGCPIITSNVSSIPEVAGDAGILIDPMNTEQLVYETNRAIQSDSLRKEMREKGLKQVKQFTWEKTAEQTEKVYELAMQS